jgi:hypothetical protein
MEEWKKRRKREQRMGTVAPTVEEEGGGLALATSLVWRHPWKRGGGCCAATWFERWLR